ncbi:TldD/PmbA family protein [Candidatus Microgenomates bacterium]|nr:TldD/PmbA family protein [Candidatus Microgenomates bacterium]
MKDLADLALGCLDVPGVDYGDIRIVEQMRENIATRNGVVEALASSQSLGFGIRVLYQGCWGFASSNDLSRKKIKEIAQKVIKIAQASSMISGEKVILTKAPIVKNGRYETPIKKNPFEISLNEKIKLLLGADKTMRRVKKITVAQAFFQTFQENKVFASTEGNSFKQKIITTGAGIQALATDGKDAQIRSYPNSFRGQFRTAGFESVEGLNLVSYAHQIAEEAVALLTAKQCPQGEFDVILGGPQLALQVHESCGHPVELDRVLGYEASFAGTSFMTLDQLGKLKYGSKIVNITADAGTPGGLGTFGFDDEGIPGQRTPIIKNGIHVGYLTSRETSFVLNQKSNGTMRADSWLVSPLIRMTNINLEAGEWDLEDLIADTKNGILMSVNKSWSIDDKRINFQFGCEVGWEIKNGKRGRMFKNPTYTGITPKFWQSCDAICNKKYWQVWGTPNCGKGEPMQRMYVGHGTAPARFRKVKVGLWK